MNGTTSSSGTELDGPIGRTLAALELEIFPAHNTIKQGLSDGLYDGPHLTSMATEVNVTRQLDHLSSWGYLAGIALLSSSPARNILHTILLKQGNLMVYSTCHEDAPIERGKGGK